MSDQSPTAPDRADEIAREIVDRQMDAAEKLGWAADDGVPEHIRTQMINQWAAALRSYGKACRDEGLEAVLTVCDGMSRYSRTILQERVKALKSSSQPMQEKP